MMETVRGKCVTQLLLLGAIDSIQVKTCSTYAKVISSISILTESLGALQD